MPKINAQFVSLVNANTANALLHTAAMPKRVESTPSDFWLRLTTAWAQQGLPVTQNGVATKLGMSQGSTRRWYTGDGYPEIDAVREIARLGRVTVDWLLMGTLPRSPVGPNTALGQLLSVWEQLDDVARDRVYRVALGELALKPPAAAERPKKNAHN